MLCWLRPSLVHTTSLPSVTVTSSGTKLLSLDATATSPDIGGESVSVLAEAPLELLPQAVRAKASGSEVATAGKAAFRMRLRFTVPLTRWPSPATGGQGLPPGNTIGK